MADHWRDLMSIMQKLLSQIGLVNEAKWNESIMSYCTTWSRIEDLQMPADCCWFLWNKILPGTRSNCCVSTPNLNEFTKTLEFNRPILTTFKTTYLDFWLCHRYWTCMKWIIIFSSEKHSSFDWIWIWIDWFRSQDHEIDVWKDAKPRQDFL